MSEFLGFLLVCVGIACFAVVIGVVAQELWLLIKTEEKE